MASGFHEGGSVVGYAVIDGHLVEEVGKLFIRNGPLDGFLVKVLPQAVLARIQPLLKAPPRTLDRVNWNTKVVKMSDVISAVEGQLNGPVGELNEIADSTKFLLPIPSSYMFPGKPEVLITGENFEGFQGHLLERCLQAGENLSDRIIAAIADKVLTQSHPAAYISSRFQFRSRNPGVEPGRQLSNHPGHPGKGNY